MLYRRWAALATTALPLLWSTAAQADDSAELEALLEQRVVTAASQAAETTDSAPAAAITLTADELRRHGFRTVADAIRFLVPGAFIEELPGASFGSRGVYLPFDFGSHVLVLVDGHVTNSDLDGSSELSYALGVPIELVDHVEVVLGPGSVLYGSNAMFGVVNVVTKNARNYRGLHLGVDAEVGRQYRAVAGGGAEFTLFGEPAELTLGLEHVDLRDPVEISPRYVGDDVYTGAPIRTRADGSSDGVWGGTWTNNFVRSSTGYGRLVLGNFRLSARAGQHRINDPTNPFDFDAPDLGNTQRWLSLDLQYQKRVSAPLELRFRLYGDEQRKDVRWLSSAAQYCVPGQLNGCVADTHGGVEWVGLEAQARVDWRERGGQTTLLGVDTRVRNTQYVTDLVDAKTGANPGSFAYYNKVDPTIGVYAQHVAELHRRLTLNLGARFDVHTNSRTALSPRAALVYQPWAQGIWKAIYSSAFQAPLPSALAFAQPLLVIPPVSLESERVQSFELAYEQRFAAQILRTSLFYSNWRDMVELVQLSASELARAKAEGRVISFIPRAFQYRNAATIESYGFSAQWEGSLAARRLRYGVSVMEAFSRSRRAEGADRQLPGIPALSARARLSYDFGGAWPTLAVSTLLTGRSLVYNIDDGGYPVPPTTEPRLLTLVNVEGPAPLVPGLRYRLGTRFATGDESAYAIGILRAATPENPEPVLFPLRRFTLLAGLEYTLE